MKRWFSGEVSTNSLINSDSSSTTYLLSAPASPLLNQPKRQPPASISEAVFNSVKTFPWRYAAVHTLSGARIALNLMAPVVLLKTLDKFEEEDGSPVSWVTAYATLLLASNLLKTLQHNLLIPVRNEFGERLANNVMDNFYELPYQRYHSLAGAPAVNDFGAMWAESRASDTFILSLHGIAIPTLLEMFAASVYISVRFGEAGAVVGAASILHVATVAMGAPKIANAQSTYMKRLYDAFGYVIGQMGQYTNVNMFNAADVESRNFNEILSDADRLGKTNLLLKSWALLAQSGLMYSLAVFGVGFLALNKENDVSNVDDLLWVLIYLAQFAPNFDKFSESVNRLVAEGVSLQTAIDNLNKEQKTNTINTRLNVNNNQAKISFNNVTLTYEGAKTPVISDLSLDIAAGQVIVLTGESGSGKTSLFNLLQRYYEPNGGEIRINGQNIAQVSKESLRDAFAVVPQNFVFQNKSLRQNVAYANSKATPQQIDLAIQKAGLEEVLVEKQNEALGPEGNFLSGGQKQRLAIARAYIRNAPILILDEPTSALDAATEKEIFLALGALVEEKKVTTLVITHRLGALQYLGRNKPHIIVLSKGKIAEHGLQEELLKNKQGLFYAQMQVTLAQEHLQQIERKLQQSSSATGVTIEHSQSSSSSSPSSSNLDTPDSNDIQLTQFGFDK